MNTTERTPVIVSEEVFEGLDAVRDWLEANHCRYFSTSASSTLDVFAQGVILGAIVDEQGYLVGLTWDCSGIDRNGNCWR